MRYPSGLAVRAAVLLAGFAASIAGSLFVGRTAMNSILMTEVKLAGEDWADHFGRSVPDLGAILRGDEPAEQTKAFLQHTRQIGHIVRYEISDLAGQLRMVVDRSGWRTGPDISSPDTTSPDTTSHDMAAGAPTPAAAAARESAAAHDPHAEADQHEHVGHSHGRGGFKLSASTSTPLRIGGEVVGSMTVFLDHAEHAELLEKELSVTAAKIFGLTAFAFLMPMGAVVWQTRRREEATLRLVHMANHDALTGLMNRSAITARIGDCLAKGRSFAVHFIDLDRFKDVNDTLGHGTGDALLKAVATRLRDVIGPDSCIGRLGGDEFALLQPLATKADHAGEAARLANRVVNALAVPLPLGEHDVQIGASVGTALSGQHGTSPESLLKSADIALYQAKRGGRGRAVAYDPAMEAERHERLQLEQCLREAAAHGRFELAYQPLYETNSLKLRGFEALLRMTDAAGRPISPAIFIPLAEEMGLIDRIGRWVLREACRSAALWPDDICLSVNLSPQQFESGLLVPQVAEILVETGLKASRLELEVTESLLLNDIDTIIAQLEGLKRLGVSIALDDFGTGYSSLSYLWRFPFDKLKVDRSFMQDITDRSSKSREVLDTIIALGRVLELRVTAEGVETCAQADALRELKCDQLQGFLFGQPQPATEVAATILRGVATVHEADATTARGWESDAA